MIKIISHFLLFFFCNLIFSQSSKIKQLESQRLLIKKEIENINSLLFDNTKTTKIAYNDLENISIKINSDDRVGLIRDVTEIISKEGLNIISISTNDINTGKSILIEVDSNGLVQQSKIYSIIETIDGVNSIDTI